MRRVVFLLMLSIMVHSLDALADEYHYNNLLIGDRASGMGGAYTAIADDATGMYYNPAGIAYSSGKNLSASVNAFYFLTKRYDNVIGGQAWQRTSSALLPNYFGVIQPIGKFKFGFSYAVPDSINEDQDQTFNLSSGSQYTVNFNNEDNTYNFGPTFAAEIRKDLAVGITLYAHQRKAQIILNQLIKTQTAGVYEWSNTYFELNEWGIRPVLGIAWSPIEKLSLGFSVSKALIFSSRATTQLTCSDTLIDGGGCFGIINGVQTYDTPLFRADGSDNTMRKYPMRVALGAAYFASSSLLLSADITHHTAVKDAIFGDKEPTTNVAMGAEYYATKNWALRGGLFTNMANTADIQAGVTSIEEHIDLYGGSLSISHFTRNTSVTLGGSMSYGSGKAQITGDKSVQDATTMGWSLFLSSSYSY